MASAVEPSGGSPSVLGAVRARLGLVLALFAVATLGWAWTAQRMRGMDTGPWTDVGGLGWFLAVWVVMMAAMMFPSVAPTIALYTRATRSTSPTAPWLFAAGYLLTWTAAGLVAYLVGAVVSELFRGALGWDRAGQDLAAGTLLLAALYEVTPIKDVCLSKCRTPLGSFLGSWRAGRAGAVRMGVRNGLWCVGCCWALMAALFALGVMSVTWMAFVAGIIALEKTLPWRRAVTRSTAVLLVALGAVLLVAPEALPGLTVPSGETMQMG